MIRAPSTSCLRLLLLMLTCWACQEEPQVIKSVVLTDGAYIRITNRQVVGEAIDGTSLGSLSNDVFSLEIWAAGDTLPQGSDAPTLFMIGDGSDGNEIAVYRSTSDSSMIFIYLDNLGLGDYSIPGCNWNDPDEFTQVVITYDRATLRVFGNGVSLGSVSASLDLNVADTDALIGADWDQSNDTGSLGNFWYGAFDEVRLWTKVLPASEMEFRYRNPDKLTKNYSTTGLESLLGLWRFNKRRSDGDTIPDDSGKGNDGVLNRGEGRFDFTDNGAD